MKFPILTVSEPSDPIASSGSAILLDDLTSYPIYAPGSWWALDIRNAPVDPDSDAILRFIGGKPLHPDFGPPPFGIPYVTVSSSEPLLPVAFVAFPEERDEEAPGRPGYPLPEEAKTQSNFIEGAAPGGGTDGDRHLLVLDRDQRLLFETWATRWNAPANRWEAGSGAVVDLSSNVRRPEGWTSADAAELAILPGLVRYDEAFGAGDINHAFRVTIRATDGHVWPASHTAGGTLGAPPMGVRLRLKASKDIAGFSEPIREDLPGDEDLWSHRGRQREPHVRHRHHGSALEQRRSESGFPLSDVRRLRGDRARLALRLHVSDTRNRFSRSRAER